VLWRIAKEHLADPKDQLITYMVHDDRWRRAASLPFTREVSRISGHHSDFTQWRAARIDNEIAERLACQLQALAREAERQLVFQVLLEHEAGDVLHQLGATADLLIVSAELKQRPVYAELAQLRCEKLFIDSDE
jgi:hypothetical protein